MIDWHCKKQNQTLKPHHYTSLSQIYLHSSAPDSSTFCQQEQVGESGWCIDISLLLLPFPVPLYSISRTPQAAVPSGTSPAPAQIFHESCSGMACLLLQPWGSLFCFSLLFPSSSLCPTFWARSCPGVPKVPSQGQASPAT